MGGFGVNARKLEGWHRQDVLRLLGDRTGLVGIELGVAAGEFSRRMVQSGRFDVFFGVDMYADTHDVTQYKEALTHVGLFAPYKLLRMTFDEAYDLFADESVDFIYIDGYAHTGQEGGDTIWKWARKVRIGGLIAGDDYHSDWPLVVEAVDAFAEETGFDLVRTTAIEVATNYSGHPSWAMIKTAATAGTPPAALLARGKAAGAQVAAKRRLGKKLGDALRAVVGQDRYHRLREWNRGRKKRQNTDRGHS
jgi:Methyltransferase domain